MKPSSVKQNARRKLRRKSRKIKMFWRQPNYVHYDKNYKYVQYRQFYVKSRENQCLLVKFTTKQGEV